MNLRGSSIAFLLFGFALAGAQVPAPPASAPATPPQKPVPPVEVEIPFPADIPIPPATVMSPEETLATLKVPAGFRVELVASEPMITAPVAMQFDEHGRLWVVEMNGYMPNIEGKGEDAPNGRVVVCEDTDNDGRMDKSTVFLDGLVLPRAITLRKGGALVAEPPVVYWCPDGNGDLKADAKEPLIANYTSGGNPEHMPNGLVRGLDNWLYNAKSNRRYRFTQAGELKMGSTFFRGQWGVCQDDWGRLYYNYNSDQLRADLLPAESVLRNSNFKGAEGVNVQIARSQRVWPGRVNPGINRGYRKAMLTAEGKLAEFTAASGPLVYRGDLLPAEFRGNSFVPEPSANMIKRNVHTERDGDIMAKDAYPAGTEFLTSTSERFRPVNLYDGPDGAIYVTDISRGVIQHITYVTPWLRRQYVERGLDQPLNHGRVWRIVPEGAPRRPAPQLGKAASADLVAALGSANGWTRDTAQRLLVERADPATVPLLESAAKSAESALARLHALWTLEGMEKLTPDLAVAAFRDAEPKVRAAAVRLSQSFLRAEPKVGEALLTMGEENAVDVQLQLLCALGDLATKEGDVALAKLLSRCSENHLARTAALSGLKGRELEFLNLPLVMFAGEPESPGRANLIAQLARCVVEERIAERVSGLVGYVAGARKEFPLIPPWELAAILDGLTGVIPAPKPAAGSIAAEQAKLGAKPQGSGGLGKGFKPFRVEAEPPLIATLRDSPTPEIAQRAGKVAALFVWPGKPGYVEEPKAPPLTPAQVEFVAAGKQLYGVLCAACHQPTGLGQEGLAPPVANSDWVTGPEGRLARIVLQGVGGPITVNGKDYNLDMPGLAQALNDEQVAQILSYVRRDFGNEAPFVETAAVTKVRESTKDRGASWTAEELLNIH